MKTNLSKLMATVLVLGSMQVFAAPVKPGAKAIEVANRELDRRLKVFEAVKGNRENRILDEVERAQKSGRISGDVALAIKGNPEVSGMKLAEVALKAATLAQSTAEVPAGVDAEVSSRIAYINQASKAVLNIVADVGAIKADTIKEALSTAQDKRTEEQHGIVALVSSMKVASKLLELNESNEESIFADSYTLFKFDKGIAETQKTETKREKATAAQSSFASGKALFGEKQTIERGIKEGKFTGEELVKMTARVKAIEKLLKDLFDCI